MKDRLLVFFVLLIPAALTAQSFAKLESAANQAFAKGQFAEAAPLYEQAARLKNNRPETMKQAAECYYLLRDYAKAAECYRQAEAAFGKNDLAALRYGRSLKQAGQTKNALFVFRQLATDYQAGDRDSMLSIFNLEIGGCLLALDLLENQALLNSQTRIIRLNDSINSLQNELAPIRWSEDVLYFFTKARGRTEMMRSLRSESDWQAAQLATGLPPSIKKDLGSGTLSADGHRFYCTRCPEDDPATGIYPPCALYLIRRTTDNQWSEAQRLSDQINLPDATILTPFVTDGEGRELLFFASDRPGGFGGLDLYGCERPLDGGDQDFSLPQNLGPLVNSTGDDLAPYFDPVSATLWFSSSGHVTLGGLDVFDSQLVNNNWSVPQHLDPPVNSTADDLFFVPDHRGRGGILVSNRLFGPAKNSTRHNDLFEIQSLR